MKSFFPVTYIKFLIYFLDIYSLKFLNFWRTINSSETYKLFNDMVLKFQKFKAQQLLFAQAQLPHASAAQGLHQVALKHC